MLHSLSLYLAVALKIINRKILYGVIALLILSTTSLSALDGTRPRMGVSIGLTLDITPFGIERKYVTIQGTITTRGTVSFAFMPTLSLHTSSQILRFPIAVGLNAFPGNENRYILTAYLGFGPGFKFENGNTELSLIFSGGLQAFLGPVSLEIPLVSSFRKGDFDTDIGFLVGYSFNFGSSSQPLQ